MHQSNSFQEEVAGFTLKKILKMNEYCRFAQNYDNREKFEEVKNHIASEYTEEIIPIFSNKTKLPTGFVFLENKEVTIAYRGTKNKDDVMKDIKLLFRDKLSNSQGLVHRGFHQVFQESFNNLRKILIDKKVLIPYNNKLEMAKINKNFRINCTGFSLGAAVAQITAWYLTELTIPGNPHKNIYVATFGSPRVFSLDGVKDYNERLKETSIRLSSKPDIVTALPPTLPFCYLHHAGEKISLSKAGHKLSSYKEDIESLNIDEIIKQCSQPLRLSLGKPDELEKSIKSGNLENCYNIEEYNEELAKKKPKLESDDNKENLDPSTDFENINEVECLNLPQKYFK